MSKLKLMTLAAALLAISVIGAEAAPAVPASGQQAISAAAAGQTEATKVQYFRNGSRRIYGGGGYGYRRYGGWRGPAIGLGVGALVAGAIIANRSYAPRRGYYYDTYAYDGPYYYPEGYAGDPRKICADHFRSFEWRTGMYTTYGGERKLCPYLRG
ncbi:MAG: BA14K family protein [Hyphomicrobiaceae bacterium]